MPTPRDSLRLMGDPENPRLVTRETGEDHTEKMQTWIQRKLPALEKENLCGFIFKSRSPSSGLYRIRVYGDDGKVRSNGTGLFARAFTRYFPRVPVEEADRLNEPKLRGHFIESVFSFQRWRRFLDNSPTLGKLVAFHTENKLLILSHSLEIYRQMGKLVARGEQMDFGDLLESYEKLLFKALVLKPVFDSGKFTKHQNAYQ